MQQRLAEPVFGVHDFGSELHHAPPLCRRFLLLAHLLGLAAALLLGLRLSKHPAQPSRASQRVGPFNLVVAAVVVVVVVVVVV